MSDDHREFRYVGAAPNPNLSPTPQRSAPRRTPTAPIASSVPTRPTRRCTPRAAKDIVAGALRGVNGTIFAYGQTGGGKTHTMRAVTRAAARDVFDAIAADDGDCEYLLHPPPSDLQRGGARPSRRRLRPGQRDDVRVRVRVPGDGHPRLGGIGVPVPGGVIRDTRWSRPSRCGPRRSRARDGDRATTAAPVDSREALEGLLREVEARRQVGATGMNAHSRSHQIVRLTAESRRAPRREPRDEGAAEVRTGDVGDFTATPTSAPVDAEKEEEGSEYDSPAESFDEDASSASARTRRRPGKKSNRWASARTLNFVDPPVPSARIARVSGARLKEGCHINRSLLTSGR